MPFNADSSGVKTQAKCSVFGLRRSSAVVAVLALGILIACSSQQQVRFGYVATGQGIYAFRMNSRTGAGSQIFGSPFVAETSSTAATSTSSVAVHPSNRFLYAANQDNNTISLFKIDPTTGALTEVLPRTSVGLSPAVMTMDSGGNFLFVGDQVLNDVWVFSIGSSGALTFVSRASVGSSPSGLTLTASGNFLYVPVPNFSAIYVFSVSSGSLTPVGLPFTVSGGVGELGIDPGGNFLYVPNPSTNTVTVLRIQPGGTLKSGPGAFATGTTPVAAATNPTGAYLYVANYGSTNVSQFQVNSTTGALTALTTATASVGTNPSSIVIDPDAKFVFVINQGSSSVSEFTVSSDGTLATTGNTLQLSVVPRSFSLTK